MDATSPTPARHGLSPYRRPGQPVPRAMGRATKGNRIMSLGTILVIILIIALLGGFSGRIGGYGYGFGHGGVGVIGVLLIVVLVLLLTGRI
jgi:hypothetical protein